MRACVHVCVRARAHMHVHGELWLVEEGIPNRILNMKGYIEMEE